MVNKFKPKYIGLAVDVEQKKKDKVFWGFTLIIIIIITIIIMKGLFF